MTGGAISGIIADLVGADFLGWRIAFASFGMFVLVALFAQLFSSRRPSWQAKPLNLRAAVANFQEIFSDPRAKTCCVSEFLLGLCAQGFLPFIGVMLLAIGETRAAIAGLLIAAWMIGALSYTVTTDALLARLGERHLMSLGGTLLAIGLAMIALYLPWPWQVPIYVLVGFGFTALRGTIQLHMTELSQTARGSAVALDMFCWCVGQAVGPIFYGVGFAIGYLPLTIFIGALIVLSVGFICSFLLHHNELAKVIR